MQLLTVKVLILSLAIFSLFSQTGKFEGAMSFNPLTAGTEYISFFHFLLPQVLPFDHVKDKM